MLRQMMEEWWKKKAQELQKATDRKDSTSFFNELKNVCGAKSSGTTPIQNSDESSLLTDKGKILERWAEHFKNVLNFSSIVSDEALDEFVQLPVLCRHLCRKYRKLLDRCAQAKQLDQMAFVPVKLQIQRTKKLIRKLTSLFCRIYNDETASQEFRDVNIVHLCKRKGNRSSCDNRRGVSLLLCDYCRKYTWQSDVRQIL